MGDPGRVVGRALNARRLGRPNVVSGFRKAAGPIAVGPRACCQVSKTSARGGGQYLCSSAGVPGRGAPGWVCGGATLSHRRSGNAEARSDPAANWPDGKRAPVKPEAIRRGSPQFMLGPHKRRAAGDRIGFRTHIAWPSRSAESQICDRGRVAVTDRPAVPSPEASGPVERWTS
jgi:hypothetical protein